MELKVPKDVKILTSSHISVSKYSSEEIVVPEGIQEISNFVFDGYWMEKIVLPKTLKKIGKYAFSECRKLKEIILPEGVEEIGEYAFKECYNLEYVFLPSTLKKIGNYAFGFAHTWYETTASGRWKTKNGSYISHTFKSKIKRVLLPAGIKQIEEYTLGVGWGYESQKRYCFASEKSNATICAENAGFSVIYANISEGAIIGESICDSTLYYLEKYSSKTKIPEGVKKIAPYAFYDGDSVKEIIIPKSVEEISSYAFQGCKKLESVVFEEGSHLIKIAEHAFLDCENIEEIIIPNTVTEIGTNAFKGCYKLSTLTFQDGSKIKKIGSKVFEDFVGSLVDLPSSVEELASNAFPKDCIVSIGGEMPRYISEHKRFEKVQCDIKADQDRLLELQMNNEVKEQKLKTDFSFLPAKFEEISRLQASIERTEHFRDDQIEIICEEREYLYKRTAEVKSILAQLQFERENCSFFAFTRKRELDEDIERKRKELQSIEDEIGALNIQETKQKTESSVQIADIKIALKPLLKEKTKWDDERKNLIKAQTDLKKEIGEITRKISEASTNLEKDKKTLTSERNAWIQEREKILRLMEIKRQEEEELARKKKEEEEELARKKKLESEKKKLLDELNVPKKLKTGEYKFTGNAGATEEEQILNKAFLQEIKGRNQAAFITKYNSFLETNTAKLARIEEINLLLGYEKNESISHLIPQEAVTVRESYLPKRFSILSHLFGKREKWTELKESASEIQQKKSTKANAYHQFFKGTDYLAFLQDECFVFLFSYCVVIAKKETPMRVFTYDQTGVFVESRVDEEIRLSDSFYGEILGERHQHLNADGSVSRRHKNNPIIKTVRYTALRFECGGETYRIPVRMNDIALRFENAYNDYCKSLTGGLMKDVYAMVTQSVEHREVVAAMDLLDKEEARLRELEKQRALEEKQRQEEERKAAVIAAEERKKAIIQRQRELNEERKREAERQVAERRRVVQLFDDDFDEAENANVDGGIEKSESLFEVVGNRLISNNVFKVTLKALDGYKLDTITAYFVSKNGEIISNKKKVAVVSSKEVTVGFVLNSGIDYTSMQECLMRFESAEEKLWDIGFKMNISFYSDF